MNYLSLVKAFCAYVSVSQGGTVRYFIKNYLLIITKNMLLQIIILSFRLREKERIRASNAHKLFSKGGPIIYKTNNAKR